MSMEYRSRNSPDIARFVSPHVSPKDDKYIEDIRYHNKYDNEYNNFKELIKGLINYKHIWDENTKYILISFATYFQLYLSYLKNVFDSSINAINQYDKIIHKNLFNLIQTIENHLNEYKKDYTMLSSK